MRRSCLSVLVSACALGMGVGLVTAQGREPNGLPDVSGTYDSGTYDGNVKIKFRHMETDGENGKKKEPFTRVLFQRGSAVDGNMILGEPPNEDQLFLSGQVGNGSLFLETIQAKCAITRVGRARGAGDKLKLKVVGVVIDQPSTEVGEIKFTAKWCGPPSDP